MITKDELLKLKNDGFDMICIKDYKHISKGKGVHFFNYYLFADIKDELGEQICEYCSPVGNEHFEFIDVLINKEESNG